MSTKPLVLIAEPNSRPARLLEELIATTLDVECVRLHRTAQVSSLQSMPRPSALVVDSAFGGGPPCRFLRELAATDPTIMARTLLTTADVRDSDVVHAISSLGLFGFCEKPVRGNELVQALALCIKQPEREPGLGGIGVGVGVGNAASSKRPRKPKRPPELGG